MPVNMHPCPDQRQGWLGLTVTHRFVVTPWPKPQPMPNNPGAIWVRPKAATAAWSKVACSACLMLSMKLPEIICPMPLRAKGGFKRSSQRGRCWRIGELVKRLCGCSPIERLSGGVEGSRDGCNLLGAVHAEIGTFGKVLAQ